MHFRSSQAEFPVGIRGHVVSDGCLVERWPSCTARVFVLRTEQRRVAYHARVNAGFLVRVQVTCECLEEEQK